MKFTFELQKVLVSSFLIHKKLYKLRNRYFLARYQLNWSVSFACVKVRKTPPYNIYMVVG